jgi:Mrp family chromosome partitioning ATPase
MTTTNRAFIKIYRHDPAETTPRALAAPAMRPAALAAASVEFVSSGALLGASSAQSTPAATTLIGSIDVLGPPAQLAVDTLAPPSSVDEAVPVALPPRPTRRTDPGATSQAVATTTTGKRPLSAFIPRATRGQSTLDHLARPEPQIARPSGPEVHSNRPDYRPTTRPERPGYLANLHPGTTVASFRWPDVCRVLSRQYGGELDRVAEVVSQHARAGQSLIGVLGLFPGSGCTTLALSLAERLAGPTHNTILVDGNFCNPRLAALLDAVPTAGWQEVLRQETPLGDAIVRAADDLLDLLAITAIPTGNEFELVAAAETTRCAHALRAAYGITLIDLGPFFDASSRTVTLELIRRMEIDAVLAVAGPQPADLRDLDTIDEHLQQAGCALTGVIENRVVPVDVAAQQYAFSNF